MSRLIDADAFAEKIKEISIRQGYYDFYPKSMSAGEILDSVIADLKGEGVCGFENAPTVDAVPVVRCVECKYLDESLAMGGWDGSCRYWNTHSTVYSGFCSFGKKATE